MNATEHFDWSVGRAMEYVELGDAAGAQASLTSDLGKHEGTADILHMGLQFLFVGEIAAGGVEGARRFIKGLPRPVVAAGPYGVADYHQPLTEFERRAGVVDHDDVPPNAGSAT